jgi:hypothetical protein
MESYFTMDLLSVLLDDSISTIVVDGLTEEKKQEVLVALNTWWRKDTKQRRFIIVSSVQLLLLVEDLQLLNMHTYSLPGWTLEEYIQAVSDDTFYQSVEANLDATNIKDKEGKVTEKYVIAGASARWMFYLNTKQAKEDIIRWMSQLNNMEEFLAGLLGNTSRITVNHLVTSGN